MTLTKSFALASALALPLMAASGFGASAETSTKKATKDQLSAYEAKCSSEATAKGLTGKNGKAEERKTFRAACIKKLVAE